MRSCYPQPRSSRRDETIPPGLFNTTVKLGSDGFEYADLYDYARLADLAGAFDTFVRDRDADLFKRFDSYRIGMQSGIASGGLTGPEESALLIAVGRELGIFLAQLFHTDAG